MNDHSITKGVVYPFDDGIGYFCRSPPLTLSPSDNHLDLLKRRIKRFAHLENEG